MAYVDEVRADNPTAYWRLGEASGTTAQEDDNLYDGTYQNTPTLGVAGALVTDADTAVTFAQARSRRSASPTTPPYARRRGPTRSSSGSSETAIRRGSSSCSASPVAALRVAGTYSC